MTEPNFQTATHDGQTFVYTDTGQGPLVVLVHGFPDLPHGWFGARGVLNAAGYRTVVPYLRGYHPDTIVPGRPYGGDEIGDDAVRLLDALGEKDCVLVGHDWGAGVTYQAAKQARERFRGICTSGIPHLDELKLTPKVAWAARHFLVNRMPWALWLARRNDFAYIDTLVRRWAPSWDGPEREETVSAARRAFEDPRVLDAAFGYYRDVRRKRLGRLSVPALLVGDTQDGGDPQSYERSRAHFDAECEAHVIEGVGHWPHREAADRFHELLLDWLSRLS